MVLHNVNYSFREISQHASRDGARFLRILRPEGVKLSVLHGRFLYSDRQTDRSFPGIVTTVVNQNQKACIV